MSEIHTDFLLKQTLKSLAHISTMGVLLGKEEEEDIDTSNQKELSASDISQYMLKSSQMPKIPKEDALFNLFVNAPDLRKARALGNGPQALESQKVILNAFLKEVRHCKPEPLKYWSALQHYIYFVYRNFISSKPSNTNEIYPSAFTKKIRELIESLLREDKTQLFIRLLALLREYALVAKVYFNNSNVTGKVTTYLVSLMSYYSAFCSAADKLSPLLPEFDILLMDRFQVNWLCLNKSIFYHYIYLDPCVQSKIPAFRKLQEENKAAYKNLLESYECFKEDMALLAARWNNIRMCISVLSKKNALENPGTKLLKDWVTFSEHTKILKTNYWIIRSADAMKIQDLGELDAHVLSLVGNMTPMADPLIDSFGHCLCEDCLAAEFRNGIIYASVPTNVQEQVNGATRLMTCYICQEPINLDALASHIVTKHQESPPSKSHERKSRSSRKLAKLNKHKEEVEELDDTDFKEAFRKLMSNQSPYRHDIKGDSWVKEDIEVKSFKDLDASTQKLITETALEAHTGYKNSTNQSSEETRNPYIMKMNSHGDSAFKPSNLQMVRFKFSKEPLFKLPSEASSAKPEAEVNKENDEKKDPPRLVTTNEDYTKPMTVEEFDRAAERLFSEYLRKRAGLTQAQVLEACQKGAEKVAEKKAAEKKAAEKKAAEKKAAEKKAAKNPTDPKAVITETTNKKRSHSPSNSNTSTPQSAPVSSKTNCQGHPCGHTCSQFEEFKTPLTDCEHYKELRKCDCRYCEVLGSTFTPLHTQKTSETRDRLRTRLHQRKERGRIFPSPSPRPTTDYPGNTIKLMTNPKVTAVNPKTPNLEKNNGGNGKANIDINTPARAAEAPQIPSNTTPIPSSTEFKSVNAQIPIVSDTNSQKTSISRKVSVPNSVPSSNGVLNTTNSNPPLQKVVDQSSVTRSVSSLSTSSLNSLRDNGDSRDINELLNFIEGNKNIDKLALAQKKAAKKARQKQRKEEERKRVEMEAKRKEEERLREERKREEKLKEEKKREEKRKEEKRKEEERLKAERLKAEALAAQQLEKSKKSVKKIIDEKQQQNSIKKNKKKNKTQETENKLIEETIPAMVTIKRIAENVNATPTVTITLKGSTPDQDKLLYTLVNGHTKQTTATAMVRAEKKGNKGKLEPTIKIKADCVSNSSKNESKTSKKKKKQQNKSVNKNNSCSSNELKVTLSLQKETPMVEESSSKKNKKQQKEAKKPNAGNTSNQVKVDQKEQKRKEKSSCSSDSNKDGNVNFPMLRLPPGITITKIDGPPVNRNYKSISNTNDSTFVSNQNVPVSKSGVIVVDTEKLIQQSLTANANKKNKKKNKKLANKNIDTPTSSASISVQSTTMNETGQPMVTLKNPIFHTLQSALSSKCDKIEVPVFPSNQQASIIKNENGMVTIRSPRLQQPLEGGTPISSILSDLKPVLGPDVPTTYSNNNHNDNERISSFNAQAILSGLPGIEITKIDKNGIKSDFDIKKSAQAADVSIIPTSNSISNINNTDKFNLEKDDWPYESVFVPKDILEDDMDAEERELEAFKRFCQQSIPPKRKEKVAHLNVKDIVFKKKTDVSYS